MVRRLVLTSLLRIAVGLIGLGVLVLSMLLPLIVLLPFRVQRIYVTNSFGVLIGRWILWCAGCHVRVSGHEHARPDRPAIYAANHTSVLDAFTTIWLTPKGTVGVAKKEILFYPFYGQAWWLAGHLLIDRGRTEKAKTSLARAGAFVEGERLSICILPEGTRSPDGRLLPLKKGIVYLALQTGLPIVPMVHIGAHNTWNKGTLSIQPTDFEVRFLPAIDSSDWSDATVDQHLETITAAISSALPPEQQPRTTP